MEFRMKRSRSMVNSCRRKASCRFGAAFNQDCQLGTFQNNELICIVPARTYVSDRPETLQLSNDGCRTLGKPVSFWIIDKPVPIVNSTNSKVISISEQEPRQKIKIFGENFIESKTSHCRFDSTHQQEQIIRGWFVRATVSSHGRVATCPLPVVKGPVSLVVRVSNDGSVWSEVNEGSKIEFVP
eukprot:TRINITY_DN2743_c0_g1_i1.p1 TRINITY_DN2743_c0_g1~~TRINITY_DN2743_c0_g1_i1.p1  ORF type:complete len:184 (+),score=25.17 TRINITY_DN2743_c0_g1_i1:92-643(+)